MYYSGYYVKWKLGLCSKTKKQLLLCISELRIQIRIEINDQGNEPKQEVSGTIR